MNPRVTAILVGVLAILIGVYFWAGQVSEERRKAEEEKARVVRIDPKKVIAVNLKEAPPTDKKDQKTGQGKEISLRKEDGIWRVTKPLALRADADAVQDLLSSMDGITRNRVINEAAKDLSAFGLKPAKVTVQYELEDGKKGALLFGETSPSGEGVYMAVEGSPTVYLLSATARQRFEKGLYTVRDKTVLRRPRDKIAQIAYERNGTRFMLQKKKKDVWDMVQPVKAKGDIEAVNRTLELFLGGKVQKFVTENPTPDDLSKYGISKPTARITLAEADGKNPSVFRIGKQNEKSKGYYVRKEGAGPIMELERFSVEDLPKRALEARNRRIIEFEKEAVEKIELESPKGKLTIRKVGKDDWEIEGDDGKRKGNDRRISDMLWDIKYAKISAFFDGSNESPDPKAVGETTRKVALYLQGQEKPLRFTVGQRGPSDPSAKDKEDQERWYAMRTEDGTVFLLTQDTVGRISKSVWDLRERKALSFEYNDVEKARFIYPKEAVNLVKEGRRWRMIKPLDEIAVGDKVDFIINEVYFLELESIAEKDIPDFSKPDLVVELDLKGDKKLPALRFVHDTKAKKAYVRVGDEKTVYTVETRFLENVPKSYKGFLAKG